MIGRKMIELIQDSERAKREPIEVLREIADVTGMQFPYEMCALRAIIANAQMASAVLHELLRSKPEIAECCRRYGDILHDALTENAQETHAILCKVESVEIVTMKLRGGPMDGEEVRCLSNVVLILCPHPSGKTYSYNVTKGQRTADYCPEKKE